MLFYAHSHLNKNTFLGESPPSLSDPLNCCNQISTCAALHSESAGGQEGFVNMFRELSCFSTGYKIPKIREMQLKVNVPRFPQHS